MTVQGKPVTVTWKETCLLARIFLRSLSIQSSWNFSRMQNIAFAFSLIPLVRNSEKSRQHSARILTRHLESFNTHPYLTGPILGSVVKLEKDSGKSGECPEAVDLKKALMAPYAAIGDPFFWGALRPLAAITGVLLALWGFVIAPLVFLVIYNPLHLWVRLKGFVEGYKDGRGAINFLKMLNLPETSRKIRWISLIALGICAGAVLTISPVWPVDSGQIYGGLFVLLAVLLCFWTITKGISPLVVLYGSSIAFVFIMVLW